MLDLSQLHFPRIEGYAEAQQRLFEVNAISSGSADDPSQLEISVACSNAREKQVRGFLQWIKEQYSPKLVYYPMCGWHTTPREVFGPDGVVYLSNDDDHPYLRDIGSGPRIRGDIHSQPFKEDAFDAILLRGWDIKKQGITEAFLEFRRVVKKDYGLFIIERGEVKNIMDYCKNNLQPADVPDETEHFINGLFELFYNKMRDGRRGIFRWWKR